MTLQPGVTLAACHALTGPQELFTRAQVAYLIDLAYQTGLAHGRAYDEAQLLTGWLEHHTDPPTRADRIAAEVNRAGPATYRGGPVDWDTGQPVTPP